MANPEHLDILKQGVKAWNTWREKNRSVFPDLSRADLGVAILSNADLTGANLFQADLTMANLTGANLTMAKLILAGLPGADLTMANLTGANLEGAHLEKANLRFANLTGVTDLTQPQLNQACVDETTKAPQGPHTT